MLNPAKIMKAKAAWETFTRNHPKFPFFLEAVKQEGIEEGTIIEVTITKPDGRQLNSNIKVTQGDMALFNELSEQ